VRREGPRRDRWLSMAEVAELIRRTTENASPEPVHPRARAEARRRIRRLIRRLERRDGTTYLRQFGEGENAPLFVAVSALEQLMPWDPGTLTAMRSTIDTLGVRMRRVERRVTRSEKDIQRIQDWSKRFAGMVEELRQLLGPK